MYPASTTKMVTALLALEKGMPDDRVTVGDEVNPEEPQESKAGLKPGETIKLIDLIHAMMLPSGNDAARAIAVYIARKSSGNAKMTETASIAYFAKLMNERVKQAGAKATNFVNPNGLHDGRHVSTAYDLAMIAKDAMNNERFRGIVSTTGYNASATLSKGRAEELAFTTTNKLLLKGTPYYYAGATGIKTGFTDQAGYCLVSSEETDGAERIAVVLHSTAEDVWRDSRLLLENGGGA